MAYSGGIIKGVTVLGGICVGSEGEVYITLANSSYVQL